MNPSAETTELLNKFRELDKNKNGFILKDVFKSYIDHQPRKIPIYQLNNLFETLPKQQMNEESFVTYMMGYRMKLEEVAVGKFGLQKYLSQYTDASPPMGNPEIRHNSAKFFLTNKKTATGNLKGEQNNLSLSLGRDQESQAKKSEQISSIIGRKLEDISIIIKFQADGAFEELTEGLRTVLETTKGILIELDEEVSRIIDLFSFTIKHDDKFVYIIAEVGHVFFQDISTFANEMILTLNPNSFINLQINLITNYLSSFLKEGAEKKIEDLEVKMDLDVDDHSLRKLKEILDSQELKLEGDGEKIITTLLFLLKQINVELSFTDSQKLFEYFGVADKVNNSKSGLDSIKEMQILDLLEGFIPESKDLLEKLKKYGRGNGEISVNLKDIFVRVEFNMKLEGILDIL